MAIFKILDGGLVAHKDIPNIDLAVSAAEHIINNTPFGDLERITIVEALTDTVVLTFEPELMWAPNLKATEFLGGHGK